MNIIRDPGDIVLQCDKPYCLTITRDSVAVPSEEVIANAARFHFDYCSQEMMDSILPKYCDDVQISSLEVVDLSGYEIKKLVIGCRQVVALPNGIQELTAYRNCISTDQITADKQPQLRVFQGGVNYNANVWDLTQIKEFKLDRIYGKFKANPETIYATDYFGPCWNYWADMNKKIRKLAVRLDRLHEFRDYEVQHLQLAVISGDGAENFDLNDAIYDKIFQSVETLEINPDQIAFYRWRQHHRIRKLIVRSRFLQRDITEIIVPDMELEIQGIFKYDYKYLLKQCRKLHYTGNTALICYTAALKVNVKEINGVKISPAEQRNLLKRFNRDAFTIDGNVFADARATAERNVVERVLLGFPDADAPGLILQYINPLFH